MVVVLTIVITVPVSYYCTAVGWVSGAQHLHSAVEYIHCACAELYAIPALSLREQCDSARGTRDASTPS